MKSLSVKDLADIRNKNLDRVEQGEDRKTTRIVVGMATCGIAAGAAPVYEAIKQKIGAMGLEDVVVVKTGCIGLCQLEPIVEVFKPGIGKVTYVKMTPHKARQVIKKHVLNGEVAEEYTIHVVKNKILNDFDIIND